MRCIAFLALALAACSSTRPSPAVAHERVVAAGASIQAAIDACPPGYVLHIAEGVFPERLTIDKPITLLGAGWDKTVIGPPPDETSILPTLPLAERAAFAQAGIRVPPTLNVRAVHGVELRGLRIRGPAPTNVEGLTRDSLVSFNKSGVTMTDCAVVGPFMNGITILDDSDVRIERTLVAAMWGTGIEISVSRRLDGKVPSRVQLTNCDVRNCYHRCITIASDDALVERCRISGSAWHGITYGGSSPTIRDNQIFGVARSGIYASGKSTAHVTGNVFWRNEFDGVSCWFGNADTIEGNTFVGNLREGLLVVDVASPTVTRNVFVDNPTAVSGSMTEKDGAIGSPVLTSNLFWSNAVDYASGGKPSELPRGNVSEVPGFVAAHDKDFTLAPGSAARRLKVGAAAPVSIQSPFPLQDGEKLIIPDGDGRDFRGWKRPAAIAKR